MGPRMGTDPWQASRLPCQQHQNRLELTGGQNSCVSHGVMGLPAAPARQQMRLAFAPGSHNCLTWRRHLLIHNKYSAAGIHSNMKVCLNVTVVHARMVSVGRGNRQQDSSAKARHRRLATEHELQRCASHLHP